MLQTPSWKWYYPYHFAPFAADFEDVDKMDIKFEIGHPFKPFEQLMGVFPPARYAIGRDFLTVCSIIVSRFQQETYPRSLPSSHDRGGFTHS